MRQAGISLGALAVISILWFHQWSYELFLRGHQLLAVLFIYGTWKHLQGRSRLSNIYFFIGLGVFRLNFLFQLGLLLYQNGLFVGRGFLRAEMLFSTTKSKEDIVMTAAYVRVSLP